MTDAEEQALRATLAKLSEEHRDLDLAIRAMVDLGVRDQIIMTRLKKRKLQLKDQIARIEDTLLPDIIAETRANVNGPLPKQVQFGSSLHGS